MQATENPFFKEASSELEKETFASAVLTITGAMMSSVFDSTSSKVNEIKPALASASERVLEVLNYPITEEQENAGYFTQHHSSWEAFFGRRALLLRCIIMVLSQNSNPSVEFQSILAAQHRLNINYHDSQQKTELGINGNILDPNIGNQSRQ